MRSDLYTEWLQVYQLVKNKTPENIKTFDAFDAFFRLDIKACYINNMLYDLEMELYNEGRYDLELLEIRVELCRWIYQQFSQESDLNIANFRDFEAESLWEIGATEQAENLFQDLITDFPYFTFGYIQSWFIKRTLKMTNFSVIASNLIDVAFFQCIFNEPFTWDC